MMNCDLLAISHEMNVKVLTSLLNYEASCFSICLSVAVKTTFSPKVFFTTSFSSSVEHKFDTDCRRKKSPSIHLYLIKFGETHLDIGRLQKTKKSHSLTFMWIFSDLRIV